ncbi:MAG: AAA family ATPase [Lachnospiraceae bacterium]|nr:AAA family ATPase [Lachnospiraceae bacterium]
MNIAELKKLPVGIENFEEIRTDEYYYVDKTAMIKDFLHRRGKVNLFTRPRRFGKSLNMSMLKYFFEIGCDKTLFDNLEISKEAALCERYMGKYPVVSITLKGINGADYATARSLMCSTIGNEAMRFQFLLNGNKLTDREKEQYRQLVKVDTSGTESFIMPDSVLMGSLKTLSVLLEKYYGKKVIVLIDEYDVPLAKANEQKYYDKMILLIRNIFEQVLKTNDSLYFAVLTGCLRVSKESIFTGLNNPSIFSITDEDCDSYFGFTDDEVRKMLEYYDLDDKYHVIKEWYDGYRFGDTDVYCPWDVINYVNKLLVKRTLPPQDYWSNTSSNDVVRRFIEKVGDGLTKGEIEMLVAGETVTKEIHEDLTYNRLYDSIDNIWSVLFTTGYLTHRGTLGDRKYQLTIPNMEIRNIFKSQIMTMFKRNVEKDGDTLRAFCEALKTGNAAEVEKLFTDYLEKTISIRDTFVRKPTKENFYHGILLGILGFKNGWFIKSNRESGVSHS